VPAKKAKAKTSRSSSRVKKAKTSSSRAKKAKAASSRSSSRAKKAKAKLTTLTRVKKSRAKSSKVNSESKRSREKIQMTAFDDATEKDIRSFVDKMERRVKKYFGDKNIRKVRRHVQIQLEKMMINIARIAEQDETSSDNSYSSDSNESYSDDGEDIDHNDVVEDENNDHLYALDDQKLPAHIEQIVMSGQGLKPSQCEKMTFYTHDNGGRPFRVDISEFGEVTITPTKHAKKPNGKPIVINEPVTIFIGCDSPRGQCGNTILIEREERVYLLVAHDIITEYKTPDRITAYFSIIGNNDVPYPIALSDTTAYFAIEGMAMLPRKNLRTRDFVNSTDVYNEFYAKTSNHKKLKYPDAKIIH
jgi:hypothetical protein